MTREVQRALVRYPTRQGRRWLSFDNPVEHFVAGEVHEVLPALDRVEAASRSGLWVVGMVAYDAAAAFDAALAARRDPTVPLVSFAAFPEARPSLGPAGTTFEAGPWTESIDRSRYEADVADIRARIAAGETYQVNYTMRLTGAFVGDPEALFAGLCRAQRADHLAFLDLGDAAVCSASPELFLRRTGDLVETRPMKGTRPRQLDPAADRAIAEELVRSEKDRAENTMIVDMARNDLGRVAHVGSLSATGLHTVESYPTVHQLTSTVTARTDASLSELLAATFPGASITGAPKVATSRIIAELEQQPRGIYTGAVGTIAPGGDLELNIAIRTAWVDAKARPVTSGVGGGVVWDSEPTSEWLEAHDKARILHRSAPPFRLLETMAWEPGAGAVLVDRHLNRLGKSSIHFGFDVDIDEVRRHIDAVRAESARRLRLLVGPDGAIELQVLEPPETTAPDAARPVIPLDSRPVSSDDEFLRHKTTRRQRYEQARSRFPHAPDVLLWNERGELTESTIANLVLEIDGELVTPPAAAGLLPGTLRAELLAQGRIREECLTVDDLSRADEIWLVNSVQGWTAIEVRVEQSSPAS
jgi:para-aminobenzoate synthetase/4-amino-4-deoxychorismate lyase